jgi:heat shock protein HslJ
MEVRIMKHVFWRPGPARRAAGILLPAAFLAAAVSAAELEQTDWRLVQYRTEAGLADAADAGRPAVLRFDDGRLSGSAGCNRLLGSYTRDGASLKLAPNMASTMMACPPPLMAQEQAVTRALAATAAYQLADAGLMLLDAAGRPVLTFRELAPEPLAGTRWRLTHYNNGKGGVTTVLEGTEIALMLGADGQLSGKACNNYRGGYVVDGDVFQLEGPIAATKMACPGPEGTGAQESAYFDALERVAAYRISGDELTLTDADGATLARFRAVD